MRGGAQQREHHNLHKRPSCTQQPLCELLALCCPASDDGGAGCARLAPSCVPVRCALAVAPPLGRTQAYSAVLLGLSAGARVSACWQYCTVWCFAAVLYMSSAGPLTDARWRCGVGHPCIGGGGRLNIPPRPHPTPTPAPCTVTPPHEPPPSPATTQQQPTYMYVYMSEMISDTNRCVCDLHRTTATHLPPHPPHPTPRSAAAPPKLQQPSNDEA